MLDAIVHFSLRLRGVVMALACGDPILNVGLLPLALGSGEAGREIEGPMAIVILGGLLTSTVLNLVILPTLALRFARFPAPRAE